MLIGREREAAALAELVAAGRPVVVVGEAGIGKSTLVRAVAAATARTVFEGGALSTLSWMHYLPLQRALGRSLAGYADAAAVAAEVGRVVAGGVLVLDDLQWVDAATAEVVDLLATRVGMLAAVRRGDPGVEPVLDRLRAAGFSEFDLGPLSAPVAREVVRRIRPDLPGVAIEGLVRRTGGNPLLLYELSATGEPSASLRLSLRARLRQLDAAGRDAFGLLALAGRPLPADDLGPAGAKSLLAAGLAVHEPSGIAARHALLAEVAAAALTEDERRALHARLARCVADVGEAARHHALAGESQLAHYAALRAAELARWPGERAGHLALAAYHAAGPRADELRLAAARALDEAHDWTAMTTVLDGLSVRDPQTRAWAALLRARGAWPAGRIDTLRSAITEGLELVSGTGSEVEVRLQIEQCRLPLFVDGDAAAGVRMASAALELARRTGVGEPRAHYFLGTALDLANEPGTAEHLRAAISGARRAGDLETEFVSSINLVVNQESAGSPAAARDVAAEAIERARLLGMGWWEGTLRATVVNLDLHAGRYSRVLGAAEDLLRRPLETRARDIVVESQCLALVDVGEFEQAERRVSAHLAVAAPDYRGRDRLRWVLAEAAWWAGRPGRALEHADAYIAASDTDPMNQLFGIITRAWARWELDADPGPPVAAQARPMLKAISYETEGIGLLHLGEDRAAADRLETAASFWAPYHRRGELRCAWAAGEALRRAGDLAGAIARLEAVEARAGELGMAPLSGRIRRSLRAAGVRRAAPRSGGRGGLTGRERQVLALVGEGLTSADIAARLSVTKRTVDAQIASASAKLGATSRAQAATMAATAAKG